jgi:hypothetical protein
MAWRLCKSLNKIKVKWLLQWEEAFKYGSMIVSVYRVSQELRSVLLDLIPELMLSQKLHTQVDPIHNGSGVMIF